MWRARHLANMVALVAIAAAVINALAVLPVTFLFPMGLSADQLAAHVAKNALEGAIEGLWLAIPMALVTLILFRRPSQLKRYGLAMLIVALVVTFARWNWVIELTLLTMQSPHMLSMSIVGKQVTVIALNLLLCRIAAGRFRRAILAQAQAAD